MVDNEQKETQEKKKWKVDWKRFRSDHKVSSQPDDLITTPLAKGARVHVRVCVINFQYFFRLTRATIWHEGV